LEYQLGFQVLVYQEGFNLLEYQEGFLVLVCQGFPVLQHHQLLCINQGLTSSLV
jgi:hypothetical protein